MDEVRSITSRDSNETHNHTVNTLNAGPYGVDSQKGMMMRITVKEKEQVELKTFNLVDLEPGTIIQFAISDSPVGLVISNGMGDNNIVLLCHYADKVNNDWFEIARGWKTMPITKILGKLTGITVEPI